MALTARFSALITLCMLFFLDEGGGVFMWTAPLPAWNQTVPGWDPPSIHTTITSIVNGSSNVTLQWNYTLVPGQEIFLTKFAIYDGINAGQVFGVVANGTAIIIDERDYKTRFMVKPTDGGYSVIIKTVTERENVTFQCKIILTDGSEWANNIRTQVTVTSTSQTDTLPATTKTSTEVKVTSTSQTDTLPATTKTPPEEKETSWHTLIGVSVGVIVATVVGIAVWWCRRQNN